MRSYVYRYIYIAYIYISPCNRGPIRHFNHLELTEHVGDAHMFDIINDFVLSFQTLVKWSMSKFLTSVDLLIPSKTLV